MASERKPESRFAQAGQVRLHYVEQGSGDALVCLHGAGPGASGWSNFKTNIDELSRRYRVILPDLPGFGGSDKPSGNMQKPLAFNARALEVFLDSLGLQKVSLVGNSAGGATSCRFAIDHPERVDKLILMGSAGAGFGMLGASPSEGIRMMRAYYQAPSKERMRALIQTFVYDASFVTDELVEDRYQQSMDPEHLASMRQRGPLEDLGAELGRITARTLLLWGADDRFVPVEAAFRFLRSISGSELHVFTRCGHWVQVEQAKRFNRLLLDFMG